MRREMERVACVVVALAMAGGAWAQDGGGSTMPWGYNWDGQCNVLAPNSGFVAVAGGGDHSLGLKGYAGCRGDANCDGAINWRDIDFLVAAMAGQPAWRAMFAPDLPTCPLWNCDVNADWTVRRDIDPFVRLMGTPCP